MRAVALLGGNHRQVLLDDVAHLDGAYALSVALIEEEALVCRCFLSGKEVALCKIVSQAVAELIAVGYDALLVALACDLELHLIQIDILFREAYKLGESYACGIEREQNHAVSTTLIVFAEEVAVEESVHLCLADVNRQFLLHLWTRHVMHRVFGDQTSTQQELVEGAERAETSADACGGIASVHHLHNPLPYDVGRHFCPAEVAVYCFIEPLERFQVGLIMFGRSAGVIPLVPKVFYEVFNPIHTLRLLNFLRR